MVMGEHQGRAIGIGDTSNPIDSITRGELVGNSQFLFLSEPDGVTVNTCLPCIQEQDTSESSPDQLYQKLNIKIIRRC